jgi:hypothetical protein
MTSPSGAAGLAALSICESLLLSLTESGVLDQAEARAILADAATALRNAMPTSSDPALHQAAAEVIELIALSRNSIHGA